MGLFDLFSNDSAERARDMANAGLRQGYDALSGLSGQGRDAITQGYTHAMDLYSDLGKKFDGLYGGGAQAYGDAAGANGVGGLQRATDAFKNSGQYGVYGIGLQEGLQALQRARSAGGSLLSGGADADAIKYAQDQASKSYGSYMSGLQPYLNLQGQGATAAATGRANAAAGMGTALNNSYQTQGAAANGMFTGIGNNDAGAEMNNYKVGSNILNAITGAASFLGQGAGDRNGSNSSGGFGGLMNNAKSLFSLFS